jgi:hypothetical protein
MSAQTLVHTLRCTVRTLRDAMRIFRCVLRFQMHSSAAQRPANRQPVVQ